MGGVVRGAVVVGLGGEGVDQAACGVGPRGRLAHPAQVVLPGRARRPGEHRRRDGCQRRIQLRRQGLRAEDQVGLGRFDRAEVGVAAGAHARQLVHDGAQVGRLIRWSRPAARRRQCATAGPARTARRAGRRRARRCAADRRAPRRCRAARPAALWAVRVDGPASGPAGSGAHDSSGRRWLPKTPAPAIWVVLVITDAEGAPLPVGCRGRATAAHGGGHRLPRSAAASAGRTPLSGTVRR